MGLATQKYTHDTFTEEVKARFGEKFEILGDYLNTRTPLLVKDIECNHEFSIVAYDLLRGRGCPKCNGKFRKTTEKFKEEVFELYGYEFTILGEYINKRTPILVRHNNESCGNWEYTPIPDNLLRGQKCPKCAGNIKKTHEEFLSEVFSAVGDEYTVVKGKYQNSKTKLTFRHNSEKCDYHEYPVSPEKFLNAGRRCPICNESKGERKIRTWLIENNVVFLSQFSFQKLVGLGGKPLKFDFAILNSDNTLKLLIEYDGVFHFEKQYDDDGFEKLKEHDRRKNEYCRNNNIKLLRIPYTKVDVLYELLEDAI